MTTTMSSVSGSLIVKRQSPEEDGRLRPQKSNRLAPYNPTHATAQAKALDLLRLTLRDVFFDLGCGDGRMVVAALERCYDDDFLLRMHQERFPRLRLPSAAASPGADRDDALRPRLPQRQEIHRDLDHLELCRTQSLDRSASALNQTSGRSLRHSRSHSDYSVPHLMREGDEDSELDSSVDHTFTPRRNNHKAGAGPSPSPRYHHLREGNDLRSVDVRSALSPPLPQLQGTRTPTTPVTPLANNLRYWHKLNVREVSNSPALLSSAELMLVIPQQQKQGYDIPTTIETPSPSGDQPHHAHNISELPMTDSYEDDYVDAAANVVSINGTPDNVGKGVADDEVAGGDAVGDGLQCVGIEYNQALADTAQANVRKTHIYPHVERKVCIRWGDVLEEWTPGREDGHRLQEREGTSSSPPGYQEERAGAGDGDRHDASRLTLLRDATAVFVYLLPQGLAQVKPLLHAAARRRHRRGGPGGRFRVVSYMFSIPGWTPQTVDRSSKGGCSVFLYENIHEEDE